MQCVRYRIDSALMTLYIFKIRKLLSDRVRRYETQESTISLGDEYQNLAGIHEIEADTHAAIISSNGGSLHYSNSHAHPPVLATSMVGKQAPAQASRLDASVHKSGDPVTSESVSVVQSRPARVSSSKKSRKIERLRRSKAADRRSSSVSDSSNSSSETSASRRRLLANGKSNKKANNFPPARSAMPVPQHGSSSDHSSVNSDRPTSSSRQGDSGHATQVSNQSSSPAEHQPYQLSPPLISFAPDGQTIPHSSARGYAYANMSFEYSNETVSIERQYATVIPARNIPKRQPKMGTQQRSSSLPRHTSHGVEADPMLEINAGFTSHVDDSGVTDDTSSQQSGRYASSIVYTNQREVARSRRSDDMPTYSSPWSSESKTLDRPRYKKNPQYTRSQPYSTLPVSRNNNISGSSSSMNSSHFVSPAQKFEFTDTHF